MANRLMYERFLELEGKVNGVFTTLLINSPELAKEHGVRIGTSINMKTPPKVIASIDECLEYIEYREFYHHNPWAMSDEKVVASGVL